MTSWNSFFNRCLFI